MFSKINFKKLYKALIFKCLELILFFIKSQMTNKASSKSILEYKDSKSQENREQLEGKNMFFEFCKRF